MSKVANDRSNADHNRKPVPATPAQQQLYDAFERWGADEHRWRPSTRRVYVGVISRCDRWLTGQGHPGVADATPDQLRAYLWSTADTAATRGLASKALRAFGLFLVATGRRTDDPAATLPAFRARQGIPKAIEAGQARAVLHVARRYGPVWHSVVTVLLFTGLRRAELAAVRWQDLEGRWLRVPDGKGGKDRMVPLHPRAWAAIERIRRLNLSSEYVFYSERSGGPISGSWLTRRVKQIGAEAGVTMGVHTCRHTFATMLLEGSGDIRIVQDALGHASLQTTQIYTRVRPERMRDAVAALTF